MTIENIIESVSRQIERTPDSHKGDYGRLLNIAGSNQMSGAAALSTLAALRCGVGLVRVCSTGAVINRLASSIYEAMWLEMKEENGAISANNVDVILENCRWATTIALGCGLSVTPGTAKIAEEVIKNADCPIILDADGINCILPNIDIINKAKNKLIITPHAAELARLCSAAAIPADTKTAVGRQAAAAKLSKKYNAVIIAKGVPNFISGGINLELKAGNPGLSKGGSGDVLTGIVASLAAQGVSSLEAAAYGVYLHGKAADKAAQKLSQISTLPSDVVKELGRNLFEN